MLKTERKGNWLEMIIPVKWTGKTLEEIFRTEWKAPKKLTHSYRMEGKVLVNGDTANWNKALQPNEKLLIRLFEEEEVSGTPMFREVEILFEDDHCLVVNKPPFINTHPNNLEKDTNTLINAILYYMQAKGQLVNIHQIHRLDKDTSGAILFAKHALAGAILDRKLENREIKRTYIAMVHGILKKKKGLIQEPIGRDRHHPTRRRVSQSGQDAVTHYECIKEDMQKQVSYVKCWLETGRTHQIRVHLSYLGHPLVGDVLYGGKPSIKRQALHAAKLTFDHPITEERIICHAPFIDEQPIFKDIDIYLT
ncbi:RluA family pseudouridine synthase [Bacillus sp. MRMR6]|uniref:RluA family pseudouridine synthase n=1 Tax=Bacillus sp. MRMR6 TaxID=1928617 RepID=UPI000952C31F|nr:RluA family pseudouridine synthase [Bacillus sp. MRMR6]OLS33620.1 RNA pseudouridine synthase [Bacillus sp. MRMR6]